MATRRLDVGLMTKLATKLGKSNLHDVNKRVSAYARRHRISSEVALISLANANGIGTARFLRKLDASQQAEVRAYSSATPKAEKSYKEVRKSTGTVRISNANATRRTAALYLIQDAELQSRCIDLLLSRRNFDRAINQATQVLEARIRHKAEPPTPMTGSPLIGYAFSEDLDRTRLMVASGDGEDQRGFTQILRGIVPTFRNPTHHHIANSFSQEDALRVCGFIDVLLRVVDHSTKVR